MSQSDVDMCSASDDDEYTLVDSISRREPPPPPPMPAHTRLPPPVPPRLDDQVESFHECESDENGEHEGYASTHQLIASITNADPATGMHTQ
jgi:hypothetical protein